MRRRRLPEIIVWAVALALLGVVAVMQIGASRERRYVAEMREGLHRFAVAQESFLYDAGLYAADAAALEARGFAPGAAVSITVREATADGWAAVASHANTVRRCYLFVRGAAPVGGATRDGSLECD
jgi:hypothetical protein